MLPSVFCPECDAPMRLYVGPITGFGVTVLDTFVACTECATVSQTTPDGKLIDLGDYTMADLQEAPARDDRLGNEKDEGKSPLHGRRDS